MMDIELTANAEKSDSVELALPLGYQQTLLTDLLDTDALVILARGLGLPRIVTNFVHAYDVAGRNLVLIIGANDREVEWIGEGLAELSNLNKESGGKTGLTVVSTEMMSLERREMLYSSGGVFAVTSRILVVDMLSDIIMTSKITGIVVMHAERVTATSTEAFILRLFREKNKTGFIKAFSDMPENFTTGFSPLTNMLKHMFLRTASLWPRFQVEVAKSLEVGHAGKVKDVIELSVELTPAMKQIQTSVLECIEICLRELRRSNASVLELDDDEWAVENALHTNFDVRIRRQLDPVWHRLSAKSRQIVADLTTLRQVLNYLLNYDCVSFNRMLDIVVAANTPAPGQTKVNSSPWLFLEAANVLFTAARQRVYVTATDDGVKLDDGGETVTPVLEEQPKWDQLGSVLDEITAELFANPVAGSGDNTVLIMCTEERTCVQLKRYLVERAKHDMNDDKGMAYNMLWRRLREYAEWKPAFAKTRKQMFVDSKAEEAKRDTRRPTERGGRPPPNKRRRTRGGASMATAKNVNIVDLEDDTTQVVQLVEDTFESEDVDMMLAREIAAAEALEGEVGDEYKVFDMGDVVAVLPYDGDMDDYVLEELQPRYVIMYEPDAAFVRRLEVYRASNPGRELKVFLMYYGGSIEEQRYLSAVRKEKDAFTKLIRERGNMAMVLTSESDQTGGVEEAFLRKVNTRIAGGGFAHGVAVTPARVIVDIREFRSSLPSLLHGAQVVVVPCMLTVGDYVLSPDICVERKSVPDLVSSFRDGRLYTQCESMSAHYKTVALLIEFDASKAFSLDPVSDVGSSAASVSAGAGGGFGGYDLQAKLVLLVLAFPRLKIVWSSSPYETVEIFKDLKLGQLEPDPETATRVGADDETGDGLVNQAAVDMVRHVPGVTAVNYKNLVYGVRSFQDLCNMSLSDIAELVGLESAKKVYGFINRDLRS
ncbi:hypothetical protein V1512DRAFT_263159 [Lipomyces arxii]|uniref:uncharacterized protein n=1 Tax=Lipomyces arxii TaxID=56418 RepID=UPI0034CE900A